MKSVFHLVGPVLPHHFALLVRKGRMITALAIFTEFFKSYVEDEERQKVAEWGQIRWLKSRFGSSILIQFTEVFEDDGDWSEEMHPAFSCGNPRLAAELLKDLFDRNMSDEPPCKITEYPGGKFWVEVPAIFGSPIEFVPLE